MDITLENINDDSFISPITDFNQIKVDDVVVISFAHKYEHGRYSCYSYGAYYYKGEDSTGHRFINVKFKHEGYYTSDLSEYGNSIEGLVIDKVYLRKLKINQLLYKRKTHYNVVGKHDF